MLIDSLSFDVFSFMEINVTLRMFFRGSFDNYNLLHCNLSSKR